MNFRAYKAPKMAKNVRKLITLAFFHFRLIIGILVVLSLHILVEKVLSFDSRGVTSKSFKSFL